MSLPPLKTDFLKIIYHVLPTRAVLCDLTYVYVGTHLHIHTCILGQVSWQKKEKKKVNICRKLIGKYF